jgi:hypothetical protein
MERSSLVAVVAALVLSMALSPDAWASCNSIPDAESAVASAATGFVKHGLVTKIAPSRGGVIGFKGALGRIDRIHLIPGQTMGFRIQPDGQCVNASNGKLTLREVPGRRTFEGALDEKDEGTGSNFVVSLITGDPPDSGPQLLVLASEKVCGTLDAGIGREVRERGFDLRCEPLAPKLVKPVIGPRHVQVALPPKRKAFIHDGKALDGPAKVVLTKGLPNPADYLDMLAGVAQDGCAAHCGALIEAQAWGCQDSFYAILRNGEVMRDEIPCEITIPKGVQKNVFKELCEDKAQLPADLAQCKNDPTDDLQLWEDSCGGIHIPFDWTEIRKEDGTSITRKVAGRTATSRVRVGYPDHEKRIWIPGPEFLGSTPWDDASGSLPSTDWRKPEIEPWYPEDQSGNEVSPNEAGLQGTVDKDDSIVHVYPRMPVFLACRNGSDLEGCMGVRENGGVSCECGDRYDRATCVCEKLVSPMYFQCDSGEFEGMPCTRHDHCKSKSGNSGNCSQKPSCQPNNPNRVWGGPWPGAPLQAPGIGECWNDDDCQGSLTCGRRLFDFPGAGAQVALDVKIPHGSNKEGRGVCPGPPRDDKCHKNKDCPTGKGNCRGFTLQAQEKKAP